MIEYEPTIAEIICHVLAVEGATSFSVAALEKRRWKWPAFKCQPS
jgi:hypothetical protein